MIPIAEDARIDRHGSPYAIALHQQRKARLERFRIAGADSEDAQRLLLAPVPVELSPEAMPSETAPPAARLPMGIGPARLSRIIGTVAAFYGVTPLDMISARRTADLVRPRQVAIYLCRALTTHSLPRIGMAFGNRDHTTMLNALNRIGAALEDDLELCATLERLKQDIAERAPPPVPPAPPAAIAPAPIRRPRAVPSFSGAPPKTDRLGLRYGILTVTAYAGSLRRPSGKLDHLWSCQCDCGGAKIVNPLYLRSKSPQSCGCLARERARALALARPREGRLWVSA